MTKLNLGSGNSRCDGFLNLDISEEFSPDIVCDLSQGIPLKDNSVDEIKANHIIEHLSDTIFIMNEIYRVCKHDAIVNIEVPHQNSKMAFADPTHKKIFNEESFKYFCSNGEHYWIHKSYGINCNFELISQKISKHKRYGYVRVKLRCIKNTNGYHVDYSKFKKNNIFQKVGGGWRRLYHIIKDHNKFINFKLDKRKRGK